MTNFSKWKSFESLEVASDKKVKGVDEIRLRLSEYSFLVNMFFRKCHSLVWLFVVKSDDSTIHPPNRHRRCRLTDVVDVDLPMSTTSILGLWNNPFRLCCKLFCYMNAEGCFHTTCAPCASHLVHPAHNISFLQRVLFRAECPSLRVQTPWVLQHHSLPITEHITSKGKKAAFCHFLALSQTL